MRTAAESVDARADQEAAAWFAQLNALSVKTKALEDFQVWRRDPVNDAAYERIEAIWARAGRLSQHPDTARDVADALARTRRPDGLGRLWSRKARLGYGAVALAAAATLAVTFVIGRGEAYETGLGEQRLVSLEDGTRLRLDTDTEVRVRFSRSGRTVTLNRGQAFFEVAHDRARPFVVRADGVAVRALGTRFDVRRLNGEVQVTLVEGSVEVTDTAADARWRMTPGEGLSTDGQALPAPEPVDVAKATSWTSGRLIFRTTPLAQAVAEVNRYSAQKVVIDTPDLQAVPVNGVFEVGDTQAFVAAVSGLFQLQVTQTKDEVRLKPRG